MATKKTKKPVYSPVASVIREAAASGNQFAQYLIQSRDYFAEKNEKGRKEQAVASLKQSLIYTKHSKCRRNIERQLQELGEAK